MSVSVNLGLSRSFSDQVTRDQIQAAFIAMLDAFEGYASDTGGSIDWSTIEIETETDEIAEMRHVLRKPTIYLRVGAR